MILEGKGYTLVDGVKHTWEEGDVLNLPLRAQGHRRAAFQHRSGQAGELRGDRAELARLHLRRPRLGLRAARGRSGIPALDTWTTARHRHGHHGHGGRTHVHASVDHLANELGNSTRLAIRLDSALMEKLGVAADAIVRVATERGRSILARLDPPFDTDAGTGVVRLDRFVRQALKAHLNEIGRGRAAEIGAGQAHRAQSGGRRHDGA